MMEKSMSYEEFKESFREQLKNTLGDSIEIQEQNCLKNMTYRWRCSRVKKKERI